MKKKLEADLISIAHRILKLKGREDVVALHLEAQKVYEKLAVLKFYEENIVALADEIPQEILREKLVAEVVEPLQTDNNLVSETTTTAEVIAEESNSVREMHLPESEKSPTENIEASTLAFEPSFEQDKTEPHKKVSLEDFLIPDFAEPDFVKVEDVPTETKEITNITFERSEKVGIDLENKTVTTSETQTYTQKTLSLNDKLNKGINIGLNDRIAFVKHLFDGSNEEYNRVLSQLSTFDTYEEALSFVENLVKPDYNHWENKEEYASRFLHLIEKKFV